MSAAEERRLAGLIDKRLVGMLGLRPADSDGWGMLDTLKTVRLRSPDGKVEEFKAGVTRVCRGHWAVTARPEVFRVADGRDIRSLRDHARALEHAQKDLERTTPTTRAAARGPSSPSVLPPRTPTQSWRLPSTPARRPLRLPR